MPDIWMDVDAALSEVPVNKVALIDDTDFKTREEAVTYDQAGMDLVWNFVTTAGAYTQTAVTPTTGGDYDWAHQGNGMYSIEITASGGASINNDTEGFGWFSGFATGILPWTGPIIGFRAAGLNNILIDSAYSATRGLTGTAVPDAVADAAGGLAISDAGGLDLDTILDVAVSTRLAPTTAARTLDVTAGGTAGIDWNNIENPTTAVDLSATDIQLCDTITTYTGNTPQTADHTAGIADIPTVAEFEARSIPSADYVVVGDTLARVTLVDTVTTNTDLVSAEDVKTAMEADGGDLSNIMEGLINKLLITEASGNAEIFNDAGVSQGTVAGAFTSVAGVTQRLRMVV